MGAPADLSLLLDRVALLADAAAQDGRRRVLGVAGPPGAGKTTLVEALLTASASDRRLAGRLAHVPMDGFHLAKAAPDTFDTCSYAAVLAAVRDSPRRVVTAPAFDHAVGEPAVDVLAVPVAADVVVTEGNYLLLDEPEWQPVRATLDEVWFCALADDVRRARLVERHVESGREPDDAKAWVERSDEANARLVTATAAGADLVLLDGEAWASHSGRSAIAARCFS